MRYGDHLLDFYTRAGLLTGAGIAPVATSVTARANRYLNLAHREILRDPAFSSLRRHILTATSVAGSPYMVTPQAMTRVLVVADRTNNRNLDPMQLYDVRRQDPGLVSTAAFPYQYFLENFNSTIAQDPTAACQPFVVSDAAGDDNTKKVFIEGIITGGYYRTASVVLNGLTPVAIDTLATWLTFTKFYLQPAAGAVTSVTAAGNITLTQGSGGTELSRVTPGRAYPRYTRLALWPVPSGVNTYYIDGDLHVEDMVNYDDEPMLHEDYCEVLTLGAMLREWKDKNRLDLYATTKREYDDAIREYKHWLSKMPGVAYSPRSGSRFSQLGSNFPANT